MIHFCMSLDLVYDAYYASCKSVTKSYSSVSPLRHSLSGHCQFIVNRIEYNRTEQFMMVSKEPFFGKDTALSAIFTTDYAHEQIT